MKSHKLAAILNRIALDCIALILVTMIVLILYGTNLEDGDSNAGSMYGLFIFPAIPIILIALGLTEVCAYYLKTWRPWVISMTPLILLIPALLLSIKQGAILTILLITILVYSILKPLLKACVNYLRVLLFFLSSVTLIYVVNASNILTILY